MRSVFDSLSIAQLHSLVVILELRNLSKAALLLESSQSLLSRHLAQFREAFNDPLLIRQRHDYILSHRAEQLLPALKQALAALDRLRLPAEFSPQHCERNFVLAASDYVAEHILPDLMADLVKVAPHVSIEYQTWHADHFDCLSNGDVDVVISMLDDAPSDYHGRMIGEDVAVCCMRRDHPLSQLHSVDEAAYLAYPHIKITAGGDKDRFIDHYLKAKGLKRDIKLRVPFFSATLNVLSDSDYLLTLPELVAQKWLKHAPICFRPLAFIEHRFRYWVIWHSRNQLAAEQVWFRQFVYQHCLASQSLRPRDVL